jgi:hypothetical protein
MKIELKNITVRDLVDGYTDSGEEGVRGYGGRLNIRPAYQREFIYKDKQRAEVIHTVRKGFPLNTMYWVVAAGPIPGEVGSTPQTPLLMHEPSRGGGHYELMDGQQRTISICQYINGDFAVEVDGSPMFFHNLTAERKQKILDYELQIYICEGEDQEKLDWFKIINIAGEKLTDQELRNAIYTGPWLADAKRWFSKTGCPAYAIGEKYVKGSPIRQELLEKAIEWISNDKVEEYMSVHQHDADADALWQHYQAVIDWVKRVFPIYRPMMKGLDWGRFYRNHKDDGLNAAELERRIVDLIADDEVERKSGIFEYLLTGNEKTLSLRTFSDKIKIAAFERQKGVCPGCQKKFDAFVMEADHIVPWHKGGKTEPENCQMLCMPCNRTKGGR